MARAIECPRAKSNMTPCYLRDGEMVVVEAFGGRRICVGCETSIKRIEQERAPQESDGQA